ncbi:forkhead box protein N1 isoform 2-T2 [Odontesthes bonariensis]|uniref:forkhead box protein N1 isoform X2 n=1 Tax=Odontesthes bonariensis TaxID=219752 RepID=UPI003F58DDA7
MPFSAKFSLSSSKSHTSVPQASLHTCEPRGTSCQQMAEYQTKEDRDACFRHKEGNTFSLTTAAPNRRHSADGTTCSGSGQASEQGPADRFHPYRRQFSDGAVGAADCLQQCSSSFRSLQEVCIPDTCSRSSEVLMTWDHCDGSNQSSYPELAAVPAEPSSFLSQSFPLYSSMSPRQQVLSKLYPNDYQPNSSKYSLQSVSTQSHQESTTQSLFPKPIYSYSILIFMALKNSKTGSLPVSEIYSFMTEHFPYFKTAPDGWKNSVRHNLSLNKCFEKVENKNGSTSRKGCLWALNPAKVEKMQEELHKWRRKDPLTVRRSMARPDLDRLLGEKPEKLRSLPPYTSLSRVTTNYNTTCAPAQLQPACQHPRRSHYTQIRPQQPYHLPPAAPHPSNSFGLFSPSGEQCEAGIPSAGGCLNSLMAGRMPPLHSAALQTEYSVGPRGIQDMLLEGDTSYDIDTLNPSLTDVQLQGNLWEVLREDSLASEPHVATTTSSATVVLQDHHVQSSCLHALPPFSHMSAGNDSGGGKAAYEDEDTDGSCWSGLHPVGYSGVESLAGYLTSCTTSVSLM